MKRRGDDFGSVAIGTPYCDGRGHYEFFRSFCWLLIGGAQAGDIFLNSERVRGDMALPRIHNMLVRECLEETDADTLCLIEDDHVFEQDILNKMRSKPENLDYDIVVASYVARRGKPVPVCWHMIDPRVNNGYTVQFRIEEVETEGTQEYDGSGVGFALIRRWLLEEMSSGAKDLVDFQWFYWEQLSTPDVQFYREAHALGARVGVDRDARIGHIGKRVWRFEDFERARELTAQQEKTGG